MARLLTIAALLCGALGSLPAQQTATVPVADEEAVAAAQEFRRLHLDGKEALVGVKKLVRQLDWEHKLRPTLERAQEEQKPVFWVQALGKVDGFT